MMKITVKEPGSGTMLTLEGYKVDTPTGPGWYITLPDERKVLIKFLNLEWGAGNNLNNEFAQAIGTEINQFLEAERPVSNSGNSYPASNLRYKKAILL